MLYIDEQLMQPIIWIAIVGIAAAGLTTGFLNTNTFTLIAQDLASAEKTLLSPVDTVRVDFEIVKINDVSASGTPIFKNQIQKCSFHSDDDLGATSKIICKLSDMQGDIIAEGFLDLKKTYTNSLKTYITISQVAFFNANDVQNINDVKIIILGVNPVQLAANP